MKMNVGFVYTMQQNLAEALKHFRLALQSFQEADNKKGLLQALFTYDKLIRTKVITRST